MPYDGTKIPSGDKPCTCTPKQKNSPSPKLNMVNDKDYVNNTVDDFIVEARKAYLKISVLASELSPSDATATNKHIFTCGLLHDYFNSRK